ncbi:MAG: hypothetical protein Q9214_006455, partial [Letrouitia sp. 1 TL-2023]
MADPVSLILGVVTFTTQTVQTTKALLGLVADIRDAPGNIKAIYKEVHAFYDVIFSLNIVLKDQDVQNTISSNKTLIEVVESLTEPINTCRAILGQLSVKLERLRNSHVESYDVRSRFVNVKRGLFSKNEISKLQQILEAEKLSISVALNVITMTASMRVLTLTEEDRAVSEARTMGSFNAGTVMSPFAHVTRETPTLQLSNPGPCDHSDLEKTVGDIETTYVSMNQILESLKAIVQSTQYAVMSADRLLHQKIAQTYQDLSKAGIQIQQLNSSIARYKEFKKRTTSIASSSNTRTSKFEDIDTRWNGPDKSDSAVIEVFFDCVSRFSHESDRSIDELQVNFFGSPEYRFESLPSFYPE